MGVHCPIEKINQPWFLFARVISFCFFNLFFYTQNYRWLKHIPLLNLLWTPSFTSILMFLCFFSYFRRCIPMAYIYVHICIDQIQNISKLSCLVHIDFYFPTSYRQHIHFWYWFVFEFEQVKKQCAYNYNYIYIAQFLLLFQEQIYISLVKLYVATKTLRHMHTNWSHEFTVAPSLKMLWEDPPPPPKPFLLININWIKMCSYNCVLSL